MPLGSRLAHKDIFVKRDFLSLGDESRCWDIAGSVGEEAHLDA
jgi:hypothetical protein